MIIITIIIILNILDELIQEQTIDKKESDGTEVQPKPFKASLYQRIGAKTENLLTCFFEK